METKKSKMYQKQYSKKYIIYLITIVFVVIFVEIILLTKNHYKTENVISKYDNYSYQDLTILGNQAFNDGNFEMSEEYLKISKQKNPRYTPTLLALANLYRYRGHYDLSEKEFLEVLAIEESAEIYTDLGKLYRNWEKYDLAVEMFEKATTLDPTVDTIYSYGLGYLYRDMGDYIKAEENFKKALEINPNNDFNYMGLGDLYRHTKRYKESEMYLKKAIEMNPKSEAYLGLGWLYIDMQNMDLAKESFESYLKNIKPKAEVYLGLGHIALSRKEYKEAKKYYELANELNNAVGGVESLKNLKSTHPEIFE